MTGSDNNVMKQFDLRDLVNDAISSGKIVRTDGIQIEWAVMKRGVVYGIPYVERDVEREFCEEDMPEERRIPSLPDNCSWIRLDSMVIQAYRNKNSAVEILHEPVKDVSKEKQKRQQRLVSPQKSRINVTAFLQIRLSKMLPKIRLLKILVRILTAALRLLMLAIVTLGSDVRMAFFVTVYGKRRTKKTFVSKRI